ncbi:MAG: hypothetical protein ACE366_11450 [Bradymonadia bacterium]
MGLSTPRSSARGAPGYTMSRLFAALTGLMLVTRGLLHHYQLQLFGPRGSLENADVVLERMMLVGRIDTPISTVLWSMVLYVGWRTTHRNRNNTAFTALTALVAVLHWLDIVRLWIPTLKSGVDRIWLYLTLITVLCTQAWLVACLRRGRGAGGLTSGRYTLGIGAALMMSVGWLPFLLRPWLTSLPFEVTSLMSWVPSVLALALLAWVFSQWSADPSPSAYTPEAEGLGFYLKMFWLRFIALALVTAFLAVAGVKADLEQMKLLLWVRPLLSSLCTILMIVGLLGLARRSETAGLRLSVMALALACVGEVALLMMGHGLFDATPMEMYDALKFMPYVEGVVSLMNLVSILALCSGLLQMALLNDRRMLSMHLISARRWMVAAVCSGQLAQWLLQVGIIDLHLIVVIGMLVLFAAVMALVTLTRALNAAVRMLRGRVESSHAAVFD